jgi:hypothetical protein
MSDGGALVRGYGNLSGGRGGISWTAAGTSGAVTLEGGQATAADADAVTGEGWTFETRLDTDPFANASVFRHVAVEAGEGATIICTALGPQGIAGHADEETSGTLRSGDDDIPYEEALISTQYDASGDPTRFGLELWPTDADQTARAAATRVSASLLAGARSGDVWAGFFRCHTDGVEGFGTYLLRRA